MNKEKTERDLEINSDQFEGENQVEVDELKCLLSIAQNRLFIAQDSIRMLKKKNADLKVLLHSNTRRRFHRSGFWPKLEKCSAAELKFGAEMQSISG